MIFISFSRVFAGAMAFVELEKPNELMNYEEKVLIAGKINETMNYVTQMLWLYKNDEYNMTFLNYTKRVSNSPLWTSEYCN